MTYYVVIDTNVLVSSLLSKHDDTSTVKIIEKIFSKELIPLFSEYILREYHEVLRRKKFKFSELLVVDFLHGIEECGILINPSPCSEILPDMKDLPFYEVVLDKKHNAYLVTGNSKHFPNLPFIVTPKEFLDILDTC